MFFRSCSMTSESAPYTSALSQWFPFTSYVCDYRKLRTAVLGLEYPLVRLAVIIGRETPPLFLIAQPDYGIRLPLRWRRASKRTTPVATLTLRDFTGPVVGRETRKSQRLRVSSWRPLPSPPMTMPVGVV